MLRRDFLAAGAAAALPLPALAQARTSVYDRILEQYLRASPESATSYGLDTGARASLKHRLDDRSAAHRFGSFDPLADAGPAIAAARPKAANPREKAYLATLAWLSGQARSFRRFAYGGVGGYGYPVAYVVSQVSGAYQAIPDFLDTQHTIETADDAQAYLDRLAAFATVLDQETAHVRADAARSAAPPGFLIDRTVKQLSDLRADPSVLAGSLGRRAAEKHIAGDWKGRAQKLGDGPVVAALDRQIALFKALRPKARAAAGVHALPQGRDYYAMCLAFHTSTSLTPDQAHALGLEQVAQISARALAILRQQGHAADNAAAGIRALNSDPAQLFPNTDAGRAQVLEFIRGRVADMYARLPRAFATLPKTPLEVRRVPPAIELGSPGAYSLSGSIDGTRPGGIYFNLHDTANWPRFSIPSTAYHEGVPGHHLQGSLINEAAGVPTLMKVLGFNAYNEGWALYAEQLGDELGAYDDAPLGRLGMLQASLFRACRIVVDTGIHWKGWSREKAIAYLIDNAGETPDDARREIERYCAWPGQACGYKIGHLEFVRLREQARAKLGARFDIKGFHNAVLLGGSMPLEVLGQVVDDWVRGA